MRTDPEVVSHGQGRGAGWLTGVLVTVFNQLRDENVSVLLNEYSRETEGFLTT